MATSLTSPVGMAMATAWPSIPPAGMTSWARIKMVYYRHTKFSTEPKNLNADARYVMVSTIGNDGICIAAITVANEKISATVYGDTGMMCGQSWFLSQNEIGTDFLKPKCVWLDADHSNAINARAMSFHVKDKAAQQTKWRNIATTQTPCGRARLATLSGAICYQMASSHPLTSHSNTQWTGWNWPGRRCNPNAIIDKPISTTRVSICTKQSTKPSAVETVNPVAVPP